MKTVNQDFEGSSVDEEVQIIHRWAKASRHGSSPPMVKSQVAEDILPGGQVWQSFPGEVRTGGGGQDSDHTSTSKIL